MFEWTLIMQTVGPTEPTGWAKPEQLGLIDTALRKVDHADPAAVTVGERLLVSGGLDV